MASADLRDELSCSVCLSVYTDPVTLTCGHNFCRSCIDRVLNTQEASGVYICPDCREEFLERPALRKNTTLCNIAERLLSIHPEEEEEEEEPKVFCTYCDSLVPAVKTCLQCETSMCESHLMKHNKSVVHTLISPNTPLGSRACPIHQKFLNYYCWVDSACICASCLSAGHSGHRVELLDEVSKKKKEGLRNIVEKLVSQREKTENRIQTLQVFRREVQEKAGGLTETAASLFRDIRTQLEDLENRVLSGVTMTKKQVVLPILDLIQQLEIKEDALSRKMSHIEELCNMSDPMTVLQETETEKDDFCDEENREDDDKKVQDIGDLKEGVILEKICTGLSDIVSGIKRRYKQVSTDILLDIYTAHDTLSDTVTDVKKENNLQEHADILLDINTAGNNVDISSDMKTASWSKINLNRPETPARFQYPQVLSAEGISSGRHYWDVETSEFGGWRVGMCYPSIDRKGDRSFLGDNNKSWCLRWYNKMYSSIHDNTETQLSQRTCPKLRIYLDYEAGQLSFYELCDPVRHLHTFTATFTEPLHAGFRLHKAWVRITGDK